MPIIDCPLTRDEQVVSFVAALLIELIDSGIDEGTHLYYCSNHDSLELDEDTYCPVVPPSPEEIKAVDIRSVMEKLEQIISPSINMIVSEMIKDMGHGR